MITDHGTSTSALLTARQIISISKAHSLLGYCVQRALISLQFWGSQCINEDEFRYDNQDVTPWCKLKSRKTETEGRYDRSTII